ncbi:MAG TPA: EamA family transporter RarD [Dietzia timorensis]|uniref:EamA family transporter RarD n=1 Tax=Dietzia timorensis TaxID=499555 RepID=A0A921F217_9ACTN|nr:EamA family transporter RarD [Dietzia timorensis]HJE90241.1 EamA family transporter RarD [Dietzia timorensis]
MTSPAAIDAPKASRIGAFAALGCYSLWGFFPAFFPLLEPAGAAEIVAHRIVWSLVLMAIVLALMGQLRRVFSLGGKAWMLLALASLLVSLNWCVYVFTVNSDRVSEAALGYFINPLVSVLFGVLFFHERLLRLQAVAVGIAAVAVVVLTFGYGHFPYLSIALALSFGGYGVAKKRVKEPPTVSLGAEVLIATPFALGFLVWLHTVGSDSLGHGAFGNAGVGNALLLVASGALTVLPLLLFATAAQRIPLALLGMLQYITPVLQMLWALLVVGERLDGTQWAGFALVLVAVLLFSGAQFRADRRARVRLAAQSPQGSAGRLAGGDDPA